MRQIICILGMIILLSSTGIAKEKGGVIAEGYTSNNETDNISVAYRVFSAPNNPCVNEPAAKYKIYNKSPIIVHVGEWFPLERLIVVGFDASGESISAEPMAIEAFDEGPEVFDFNSDMIADAKLLAIRPGHCKLSVGSLCGKVRAEIEVKVVSRAKTPNKKDKNGGR